MNLAPIIIFVYNRPEHTQKTLEALAANELASDSILYIFADGAKDNASEETLEKIKQTREIAKSKLWCKDVIVVEKETNSGLANSIIQGVTQIVNKHGKIIVLEDDLITSKYFLKYMNDALTTYENTLNVACISAYIYPVENLPELFFIKGADCWGWATWKHGWDLFQENGKKLLSELEHKKLTHAFDFNSAYPYTQMLKDQIEKKNDSWAIRWYASAFLKNKLCLYPSKTLVKNIGFDGSGTHSGSINIHESQTNETPLIIQYLAPKENLVALNLISTYFKKLKEKNNTYIRKSNLKKLLKAIIPSFIIRFIKK